MLNRIQDHADLMEHLPFHKTFAWQKIAPSIWNKKYPEVRLDIPYLGLPSIAGF